VKRSNLWVNRIPEEEGIKMRQKQYASNNTPKFSKTEARHPDIDSRSAISQSRLNTKNKPHWIQYSKIKIKTEHIKEILEATLQKAGRRQGWVDRV